MSEPVSGSPPEDDHVCAEERVEGRRGGLLRLLLLDVAGPLVVYRVCRSAGMSTVWALVLSGLPPGVGVALDWLRWRTLEVVGAIILGGIGFSVVMALVRHDTRSILLEGAASAAAFGVVCFLSLTRRRPLIFYFAQAFYGGRHTVDGRYLETSYDEHEEARSFWRTVTVVWGVVRIVEAGALAAVDEQASTGAALTANRVVPWVVFPLLFGWTYLWGNRLRARDESSVPPQPGATNGA